MSKPVLAKISPAEAEQHLMDYGMADSEIEKMEAEIAIKCAEIRGTYQEELDKKSSIKKEAEQALQLFAELNRDEYFSKKKSLVMLHGVLGFRTGTPKLATAKNFTWKVVLALLKAHGNGSFVRTVEEPAKDELLARRDEPEVVKLMEQCQILVVQDEKFYIEPKKENGGN